MSTTTKKTSLLSAALLQNGNGPGAVPAAAPTAAAASTEPRTAPTGSDLSDPRVVQWLNGTLGEYSHRAGPSQQRSTPVATPVRTAAATASGYAGNFSPYAGNSPHGFSPFGGNSPHQGNRFSPFGGSPNFVMGKWETPGSGSGSGGGARLMRHKAVDRLARGTTGGGSGSSLNSQYGRGDSFGAGSSADGSLAGSLRDGESQALAYWADPDVEAKELEFEEAMLTNGLAVVASPSDGACLYHAVGTVLGHSAETMHQVAMVFLAENREYFAPFAEGDFDAYLARKSQLRGGAQTFANHVELLALACAANMVVHVYETDGSVNPVDPAQCPLYAPGPGEQPVLVRLWHHGAHYDALVAFAE
ncbi:hypothetical protein H9P43_000878 [Blastocladiella emersonii ATCC 22665]|nr:hypothetical protein H9P43_000878 [Blastocladiella emersonii ATCC 22665]